MPTTTLSKTHPMLLIAAIALTIFSVLGSAAITGLIPSAHSGQPETTTQPSPANNNTSTGAFTQERMKNSNRGATLNDQAQPSNFKNDRFAGCPNCGEIVSIRALKQEGEGSGLGIIAGGVAGGLLGNQFGRGNGNTLMTVLGAGGGAYAGDTIEKQMKTKTAYIIRIHMADGTYRTVTQSTRPGHAIGDHVKINNGLLISA